MLGKTGSVSKVLNGTGNDKGMYSNLKADILKAEVSAFLFFNSL